MFPLTTLLLLLLAGSLTTMTTIGYGDRGPQNTPEIIFVMFAEVIGLSIFALLLQQICDLSAAMQSEEKAQNQIKDDLVQFLEKNNVSHKLITRSVDYLIYRTYFTPKTTEHLPYLTDSLQHQIRVEIYKVSVPLRVFGIGKVCYLLSLAAFHSPSWLLFGCLGAPRRTPVTKHGWKNCLRRQVTTDNHA